MGEAPRIINKGDPQQVRRALARIEDDQDAYFTQLPIIWDGLSSGQREQLNQLVNQGPVWDGNVISKCDRSDLIDYGLAVRCCFMGEDGYTAASYLGGSVFNQSKAERIARKPGSRG